MMPMRSKWLAALFALSCVFANSAGAATPKPLRILFVEYHKLIARGIARLLPG